MAEFTVYSEELRRRALSSFSKSSPPTSPAPSRVEEVWFTSRAEAYWLTMASYSVLALLDGTVPPAAHIELESFSVSPRSVSATMLRVLSVEPVLLVTQISTRLMVMPVVRLGNFCIHPSYRFLKYLERKKCLFSS